LAFARVAQPDRTRKPAGMKGAASFRGKADECWFAHHLSYGQIKLSMNKGERISQFVAGLGRETGGGPPSGRLDARRERAPAPADAMVSGNFAEHAYYRAFFRCWNEQRYYEAHDVLEQLWLKTKSRDADYFKGLIQAAGAFVHLQKRFEHPSHPKHSRRLPPAVRLFRLAEKNLSSFRPRHHGLDVIALCELLRAYTDEIIASDYTTNPWSPETAPKLELGRGGAPRTSRSGVPTL
jgi:predicted metal-dependent hydrolase